MSVYKIENKKVSLEINGQTYEVRRPKYKEIMEADEKMANLSAKEKMSYTRNSLISYGLPESVVDDLDVASVIEILEIINGSKKN